MKVVGLAIVAVMLLGINAEAKKRPGATRKNLHQETIIENLK